MKILIPLTAFLMITMSAPASAACIPTWDDDCSGSGYGYQSPSYSPPPDNSYQQWLRQEEAARHRQRLQELEAENRRLRALNAQRRGYRNPYGRSLLGR